MVKGMSMGRVQTVIVTPMTPMLAVPPARGKPARTRNRLTAICGSESVLTPANPPGYIRIKYSFSFSVFVKPLPQVDVVLKIFIFRGEQCDSRVPATHQM